MARDEDWRMLEQSRFLRGWQLVALSLGLRPIEKLSEVAPAAVLADYKVRRNAVKNAATSEARAGWLQYKVDKLKTVVVIPPGKAPLTNEVFDSVKFLAFLKRTSAARIEPRFEEIVQRCHASAPKKVPARNAKAANTAIQNSLLDLVLGMAISHYDYVPSLAGIPGRIKSQKSVFEAISEDLAEHGIGVSADQIQKRLTAACDRMAASDEREHFVEKYNAKNRS